MEIHSVADALNWHADHCDKSNAPITARVIRSIHAIMQTETAFGRRLASWAGRGVEDALALRVVGGLHFLKLTGTEPRLAPVFEGRITDQATIDTLMCEAAETYDNLLLPWLDGPPQTNEAGRSASIMAMLLWLSGKLGPRFALFEIGASAGINTMMDRYAYDLGGTKAGPKSSPMQIVPEWRGDAPPAAEVEIVSIKGCDIAPVDLSDPAQAERLKAYIWADATPRMMRMEAAIALAGEQAPDLVRMDAAEFVAEQLAAPQEEGVTKALFHTVMWQYLPTETRAAITQAMEEAGAKASADKPLAWLRVETNRKTFRHEVTVRFWDGSGEGSEWAQLAEAHPHGTWISWQG